MGIEGSHNFRVVDARLTTSGAVSVVQLQELGTQGYEAVINLLPDGHDQAVPDEASIVAAQGIDYVHIPVDFGAPTPASLRAFVEAMDAHRGRKVHVHCAANYRVTAFYGLYAEQRGIWSESQADAFVADVWDPADHPVWARFIETERARHERRA